MKISSSKIIKVSGRLGSHSQVSPKLADGPTKSGSDGIRWEVRGFCRHWKLMESTMIKDDPQKVSFGWESSNGPKVQQSPRTESVELLKVQVVSFSSSLPPPQVSCLFPWRLCHPKGMIDSSQKSEWFIWFIWYVSTIFYIFCTHSISFPKHPKISRWVAAPHHPVRGWLSWPAGPNHDLPWDTQLCKSAKLCVCQCLIVYDWWFLQIQACPENDDKWCIGFDQSALCRCACVKESVFL